MPDIAFIIVSYNTCRLTLDCLQALYDDLAGFDGQAEVIVVDNASRDDTVARIQTAFPRVRVIANADNRGFGGGNNLGMAAAESDTFVLLNSDAFVYAGFTQAVSGFLQAAPDVGMAGPLLYNADRTIQRSVFRFPTPARAWLENLGISWLLSRHPALGDYRRFAYDSVRDVDWVSGACMATRRSVFQQTGGFDEAFFMYSEETDWQGRIRRNGWRIVFLPTAQAVHLGGGSGSGPGRLPLNRHFFRSLDYYVHKNHHLAGWLSFRLAMVVGAMIRCAGWFCLGLCRPGHRLRHWERARFYAAVLQRQLTHWSI